MNDPIFDLIEKEKTRQQDQIELIASENIVSDNVLRAMGSVLTNKYAEGYPGKRYYGGCEFVDEIEIIAQERLKKLFGVKFANVQPHSGSQANQSVFLAFLKPGDKILSMSLDAGGHLTHGFSKNMSGLWFEAHNYGVDPENHLINYDEVRKIAIEKKPKLIVAGFSAYSRDLNWKKFREIADEVGAILMADIAHIAGLVATGLLSSPFGFAHVITSTTHKTLRGPRGGIVMTNDEEIYNKINSALFPGLQGGPLMHIIAAKAVAFQECLSEDYRIYCQNVIKNAKAMANVIVERGIKLLTNGTENHMMILDLRNFKNISGSLVQKQLEKLNIICNKNSVPLDPLSPMKTSGIRLGSPACTTRGFGIDEFEKIGNIICDTIFELDKSQKLSEDFEKQVIQKVKSITTRFS